MLSAFFAFWARLLERCFLLPKIKNPMAHPFCQEEAYAKPTDELRAILIDLINRSHPYFARYRQIDPTLIGFSYLDRGGFGKVYGSPCGRFVIKVSIDNDDKGYGRYVRLAQTRADNPYFPKIFAHIKAGNRQVVLMERLEKLSAAPDKPYGDEVRLIRALVYGRELPRIIGDDQHYVQIIHDLRHLIHKGGCGGDISTKNSMLRPLPDGYQLVITDPVI